MFQFLTFFSHSNPKPINFKWFGLGRPFVLGLPRWILGLLIGFFAIKALICWYVPANDIDSISSYLVRNYFVQFGPLEKTGTFEFLYTFPTTFDFMFGPLLRLHWFETLPNFLLFGLLLFILFRQTPPGQHVTVFALVFSCQALLVQMSSGKNDMALAAFALTAWWAIYGLKGSRWRIPLALFSIAAMVGTKWMGWPVGGLLFIALVYEIVQEKQVGKFLLITLLLLPLLMWVGSINTYITNWATYGSPFYMSPEIKARMDVMNYHFLGKNLSLIFRGLLFKSFDMVYYVIDLLFTKGSINKYFTILFPNARYYTTPAADFCNVGGIVALLSAGLSVACLTLKNVERPIKVSAAIALIYIAIMLLKVEMNAFYLRYLCAAYVLMIIPSAYMLHRMKNTVVLRRCILGFALLTMIPTLFMQRENLLIPVREFSWGPKSETDYSNPGMVYKLPSMFQVMLRKGGTPITPYPYAPPHTPDRDLLQFMVWSGVGWSYDYYRAAVPVTDSLMMVNFDKGTDSPVAIGPFLRMRDPANTQMLNVRTGAKFGNWQDNLGHVQYVMAWDGAFSDPRYCLVHANRPYLTIHRLKDTAECPKPYILN